MQVYDTSDGEKKVTINDAKIYLYSDPITENQEYMAPYYVLNGTDSNGKGITISLPAVDSSMIEYND